MLSGMASAYLAADCQLSSEEGRRQLRSAHSRTWGVRWTYSNFGDRWFEAAGPRLWTVFQLYFGKQTSAMNSLSGYWRLICLGLRCGTVWLF